MADVATALTSAITRSGQSPATGNIPFGNNKLTGVQKGTVLTDAATIQNLQESTGIYVASVGGTASAITVSPSPAITSYVTGQEFVFLAAASCTGATTVAVSGLAAKALTRIGGGALIANDFLTGYLIWMVYDGTQFQCVTVDTYNEGGTGSIPRSVYARLRDQLVMQDRGVIADGVTDDTAAFKVLYESLTAGKVLDMNGNTVSINSATLATYTNRSFNCPADNITIKNGKFIVTGTTGCGIFWTEKNNSKFINIEFVGNNNNSATALAGYGTAIVWNNPGAGTLDLFTVSDCTFSEFKGQAWVWCNTASTGKSRRILVENNRASGGTTYLPGDSGSSCSLVRVGTSGSGQIERVDISHNEIEATNMKTPIQVVGNSADILYVHIESNTILNAGVANGASNVNCYGISLKPGTKQFTVSDNILTNCYQAGIYASACSNGTISGNRIDGTTDTVDTTLRRGAIVAEGHGIVVDGNTIENTPYGVEVSPDNAVANIMVSNNVIKATGGSATGVKVFANLTLGFDTAGITVEGNTIYSDNHGIEMYHGNVNADSTIDDVLISNNTITALAGRGIWANAASFPYGWSRTRVTGNTVKGWLAGIYLACDSMDNVCVDNNKVFSLGGSCIYGIAVTNADTVGTFLGECSNNTVYDVKPTGAPADTGAYKLYAFAGIAYGNRHINCQKGIWDQGGVSVHLCKDTPWWTAEAGNGEFIQRLTPATWYAGNRGYIGWIYDNGAWQPLWTANATW
jgi:parallel beta-helix repeat protein